MSSKPLVFKYSEPTKAEVVALKAVAKGEADPGQQHAVLQLIVKKFAQAHDLTYIPGDPDGTAFLSGRAYVGKSILKYLNYPASKLDKQPDEEPTHGRSSRKPPSRPTSVRSSGGPTTDAVTDTTG